MGTGCHLSAQLHVISEPCLLGSKALPSPALPSVEKQARGNASGLRGRPQELDSFNSRSGLCMERTEKGGGGIAEGIMNTEV